MEWQGIPFFQPIVSVADGRIFGYETLGRYIENGSVKSLGGFFNDESIDCEEKMRVDRLIRKHAFEKLKTSGIDRKLFINIKPSWLFQYREQDKAFPTIRMMSEIGISGDRVVIEITEEEITGDFSELKELIARYRDVGCRIAVDDFSFESFDRLVILSPDYVKIDIALLKKSMQKSEYHQLVKYISQFSEEMGISVIFEGVETEEELQTAIDCGANHIQGFLFSQAEPEFQPIERFSPIVNGNLQKVIARQAEEYRRVSETEDELNRFFDRCLDKNAFADELRIDEAISEMIGSAPDQCFRLYCCDKNGLQLSSNYTRQDGGSFVQESEYRYMNWGWRPYFVENIARCIHYKKGIMSKKYFDIEIRQELRTFSYPLIKDIFLFIDVFMIKKEGDDEAGKVFP